MRPGAALLLLVLCACSTKDATPAASSAPESGPAQLALQVSDSVSIWFTSARADTAADGASCRERVLEIRTGSQAIPIPLLYTSESPVITSDSTITVHIWRHCVPADLYRVNLRTGQPKRVGP